MWQMNVPVDLTDTQPDITWVSRPLLDACATLVQQSGVTGTLTPVGTTPADETTDYICFEVALTSATGVSAFGYVHDMEQSYAQRPASIGEALAELAIGATMGDADMGSSLDALLGEEQAHALRLVAGANL